MTLLHIVERATLILYVSLAEVAGKRAVCVLVCSVAFSTDRDHSGTVGETKGRDQVTSPGYIRRGRWSRRLRGARHLRLYSYISKPPGSGSSAAYCLQYAPSKGEDARGGKLSAP